MKILWLLVFLVFICGFVVAQEENNDEIFDDGFSGTKHNVLKTDAILWYNGIANISYERFLSEDASITIGCAKNYGDTRIELFSNVRTDYYDPLVDNPNSTYQFSLAYKKYATFRSGIFSSYSYYYRTVKTDVLVNQAHNLLFSIGNLFIIEDLLTIEPALTAGIRYESVGLRNTSIQEDGELWFIVNLKLSFGFYF